MYECFAWTCVCVTSVHGAHRDQKRVTDTQEVELQTDSCELPCVFWELTEPGSSARRKCSKPRSHISSPKYNVLKSKLFLFFKWPIFVYLLLPRYLKFPKFYSCKEICLASSWDSCPRTVCALLPSATANTGWLPGQTAFSLQRSHSHSQIGQFSNFP